MGVSVALGVVVVGGRDDELGVRGGRDSADAPVVVAALASGMMPWRLRCALKRTAAPFDGGGSSSSPQYASERVVQIASRVNSTVPSEIPVAGFQLIPTAHDPAPFGKT